MIHLRKINQSLFNKYEDGILTIYFDFFIQDDDEIKMGEKVIFIPNNEFSRSFIWVKIREIEEFSSLDDAIRKNKKYALDESGKLIFDIEDIACSLEENQIKIKVITFEIEKLDLGKASILIDPSIYTEMKDQNNLEEAISNLDKWLHKINTKIFIPNQQESKRSIEEIKEWTYEYHSPSDELENDPLFISLLDGESLNSEQDKLLKYIFNSEADILVTTSNDIIRKAEKLYLRNRVLYIEELNEAFEEKYPAQIDYDILSVHHEKFKYLEKYYENDFFASLKNDYQNFKEWFNKKIKEEADVYVYDPKGELKGLLYLKLEDEKEDYSDINPVLKPKRRLKIGTLKTVGTGIRLGERFLKIAFDNAEKMNVDEIYLTLFKDEKKSDIMSLHKLLKDWGFIEVGVKSTGETVLCKEIGFYDENKTVKENYPNVKQNPNYFFLPIESKYHTDLFPDYILRNENKYEYSEDKPYRYAIEKYYISNAFNINGARRGDIMLIYRMAPEYEYKKYKSCVTGQVIIEDITEVKTAEECIKMCKGRSVFTDDEIREKFISRGYVLVLHLLMLDSFPKKVPLNRIREELGNIAPNSGPRQFDKINKDAYNNIVSFGEGRKHGQEDFDFNQS